MLLKAALATGKKVALAGVTEGYLTKEEIEELIAVDELSLDSILSEAWTVEVASTVKITEVEFKELWNEVAGDFTSVKTFDNSALAKKLLGRLVSDYKIT